MAICSDLSGAIVKGYENIRYQGVVCLSMLLRRPLGNAYMTYITGSSLPFTTVIEMTSLTTPQNYGGHHLVYLPKYVPSDDPLLDADEDEIVATFLNGLKRIYSDFEMDDVVEHQVARA